MEKLTLVTIGDQKSIWLSLKQPFGHTTALAMEEQMDYCDFGLKDATVKILKKTTDNVTKSNKCNQCDFASPQAGDLRRHLKTHSGKKCNQCDFASSRVDDLRTHLKTHSGEKSNKCNQCDFAYSQAGDLRRHLKPHTAGKSRTNATNVTLHPLGQAI